ncbi:MAG: hypothetical protein ACKVP5_11700 [Aestuariivirga sp.]
MKLMIAQSNSKTMTGAHEATRHRRVLGFPASAGWEAIMEFFRV